MIDFKKMMKLSKAPVLTDPIEIYKNLDLTASVSDLRPAQEEVLTNWYRDRYEQKDVILKLHTGEGKTLVGLLMLLSRLNKGLGPCLFVSPNKQLAEQASSDAKKFGIPHTLLNEGDLPSEFLESKKLMITHVHKVFNGMTIFGLDNRAVKIGTFVLDDSHACIDAIRSSFTIHIRREEPLFNILLRKFETELRLQGEGSFFAIEGNPFSSDLLSIPYWSWNKKSDEVLRLLMEHVDKDYIKFALPLLKDKLNYCTMYVTGRCIEIVPYYPLIERYKSFTEARQRILMSATTQEDSFFVRGLGLSAEAVTNPLTSLVRSWSGEKMIIFPSVIDERLDNEAIRHYIGEGKFSNKCTVLVPSYRVADGYNKQGCVTPCNEDEIKKALSSLKTLSQTAPIVFTNRYDGIDLADDMCRILIMDSLPAFSSLSDLYEQQCRTTSDMINIKIAQKIEQGLGRSVRGERDYTTIIITGANLVKFMKSPETRKYFSDQTNMQIHIGEEIAKESNSERDEAEPLKSIYDLIRLCLKRDEGWKMFYKSTMDSMTKKKVEHPLLERLEKERAADMAFIRRDWPEVIRIYRELANSTSEDPLEQGWYLQELAKYMCHSSATDALNTQKSAYAHNQYLLTVETVNYKKVDMLNDATLKNIKNFVSRFSDYSSLKLSVDEMLSNLSMGVSSKRFEGALQQVGMLLGFRSQRPDNEIKKGPDNLWVMPNNEYVVFECKNEVEQSRFSISKTEAGQMEMHCGWFENEYGSDTKVTYNWIHPTNKLSSDANLTHKVQVMTPAKLDLFKKQLLSFVREFGKFNLTSITEESINGFLVNNQLTPNDIKKLYSEPINRGK